MKGWLENHNPGGWQYGVRLSIDEPAPTVQATGIAGDRMYDGRSGWQLHLDHGKTMIVPDESAAAAAAKPPYRVPSMTAIRKLPWNGLTVASTFSGAGGSCLGYRIAGYRLVWASEFLEAARACHSLNFTDCVMDPRDIRLVQPADVLKATKLKVGELDLFDGSPPCQSFSTAGTREKGWGQSVKHGDGTEQRSDDLFLEYIRLVKGLQPRAFVAENVEGLIKGSARGMYNIIIRELTAAGYRVEARLLNAKWLGVPQSRPRVIFVGVRKDLAGSPAFPTPLPYLYSIRDAMTGLPGWDGPVAANTRSTGYDVRHRAAEEGPADTIMTNVGHSEVIGPPLKKGDIKGPHQGTKEPHRHLKGATLKMGAHGFNPGRQVDVDTEPAPTIMAQGFGSHKTHLEVPQVVRIHQDSSGLFHSEASIDTPAPAITTSNASHLKVTEQRAVHDTGGQHDSKGDVTDTVSPPITVGMGRGQHMKVVKQTPATEALPLTERRKFTIPEVMRLCSFPDDFQLVGKYDEQWARLGNAVPPLMMAHVAAALREQVFRPLGRVKGKAAKWPV